MTADLRGAQLRVLGIPCPRLQGRAPLVLFVAAAALFAMLSYGPHLRAAAPGGFGALDPPQRANRDPAKCVHSSSVLSVLREGGVRLQSKPFGCATMAICQA